MYKVLAIGGKDLNFGFSLAGLETCRADDSAAAAQALREAAASGEYGIVIIDEALTESFDEKTTELLDSGDLPVVIPVAGQMKWRDAEVIPPDDYIARLVRQAVGYELNIQL